MKWCDKCDKTGEVVIEHKIEGWAFKDTKRETIVCPKCNGKKIFFDKDAYVAELERLVGV